MASQTDICNLALSMLGQATITAITDSTTSARVLTALYEPVRDAELRKHVWRFSIKRAALAATTDTPASGEFTTYYNLPSDCLRVLMVGSSWPGIDLTDYRMSPSSADYVVEGNQILTCLGAPLALRYISRITDTGLYDAGFVATFAAKLAWHACERLTQSAEKRQLAMKEYDEAIKAAVRANAIEKPPSIPADDTWVVARLL